jgi:hypothetical protein
MQSNLTLEEYELFCTVARELNEYVPPERVVKPAAASSDAKGDRPGDDFNRRASWAEVLEPHGWKVESSSGDVTYWTRPGKGRGVSATTGKCTSDLGGDLLYVFSSNADPLEPDRGYSKFSALAAIEYGGDFTAAAKAVADRGYGASEPTVYLSPTVSEKGSGKPDDGIPACHDFATNDDLRNLDLGVRWVWDRWLQFGTVNLLAAEGGLGKTRFVADLCRRIHAGQPWPDGTPTTGWDSRYLAMWVAGDRNHGELLELSEKFGFGNRICYSGTKADPLGGVTLHAVMDFRALHAKAKAARPLFLVIDTAGGSTPFNLAKQEEARSFFAPLSDMAVRLGMCVIVITHLNATKNVLGKRAEERVRCVIRMTAENKEPGTARRIEVTKSNSLFPKPIGMRLGDTGNEYDDNPPPPPDQSGGYGNNRDDDDTSKGPPTKVRECSDWLQERLATAPERVAELLTEGESRGYSTGLVYKAKKHLNLTETKDSNSRKWWGLTS